MMPLKRLAAELGTYIPLSGAPVGGGPAWVEDAGGLPPHAPANCHPLAAGLLLSNPRVVLAILTERCVHDLFR